MRRVANATKPQPRNKSRNIDIAKRNYAGEVTVTVPVNESWDGVLIKPVNGVITDVRTKSVLGMLSESKLMKSLGACFDNFKIVDAHFCIDLAKQPLYKFVSKRRARHYIMAVYHEVLSEAHPNFTTQPTFIVQLPVTGTTSPSPAFANLAALQGFIQENCPYSFTSITTDTNPDTQFGTDIESILVIGAASRRVVPDAYFQVASNESPFNKVYTEPTWEQLSSYGSFIFQSKMPGTGMHLSLDVKGSSNSERMMTMPSEVLWNLTKVSSQQQAGRFIPMITYGIYTKSTGNDVNSGSRQYATDSNGLFSQEKTEQNPFNTVVEDGKFASEAFGEVVYQSENVSQGYTVCLYHVDDFNFNYPNAVPLYKNYNTLAQENEFSTLIGTNAGSGTVDYSLSIQGFITVRLKHVRSHALTFSNNYARIGLYFSNGGVYSPFTWLVSDMRNVTVATHPQLFPYTSDTQRVVVCTYVPNATQQSSTFANFRDFCFGLISATNSECKYVFGIAFYYSYSDSASSVMTQCYSLTSNKAYTTAELVALTNPVAINDWNNKCAAVWGNNKSRCYLSFYCCKEAFGSASTNLDWFGILSQDSTCDNDDRHLFHHYVSATHQADSNGLISNSDLLNNCSVSSSYNV